MAAGGEPARAAEPQTARAVVSLFHLDPSRPPSANLELGEGRYSLVFSPPDNAEEGLAQVCSPEWIAWFDEQYGADIRAEARAAGLGKMRYRLSPLYGEGDKFARKLPQACDAVAVLLWNEQEEPESVVLVVGGDLHEIKLPRFRSHSAKAPTHKGQAVLMLEAA